MIETRGLMKTYRGRRVVNNVNVRVGRGEVVGLLGPNGAGKTTTFYMVVGLVSPDKGHVYFDGKRISKLPMHKRARLGISYLPQEASVFRKLTVEENIKAVWQLLHVPAAEQKPRLDELLEEFNLQHVRKSKGHQLSGGERRRVEIARAVATNPSFLLLDEPFSGIDPIAVAGIKEMIVHLQKRTIGILITDHNVQETLGITDWSYILTRGNVIVSGPSDEVALNPLARRYYLGNEFKFQRYRSKIKLPFSDEEILKRKEESIADLSQVNFDDLDADLYESPTV
ncbi:LPS export ABC transporter ATP-binding protein [bacterium (Candidatus Blackallbacteria) CG17_big_fil_post_rev_8_21_14_2_50_48_46]|uniref:LPS export ABC transporter ATP-binding protein n=1 Tax=bacterium (Candidatus Blackallbacteria) CG17_big_fil_post_rev_8_21_14_2_50_48_46 TaxID=2014261 RepID=A0A2M7GB11_9BACT|nr:MAG: LPS export ABC transporter ATP-binding protein [bacterium (Candidatus Blackallbacteria) CG18_big_fil_WC_8_21_14_2_50_49_26]PIW19366.1 MAG: LPS export ABC transporter ATP-binding protein [bacterium (Candidatus Blackallbacteria) CG17_big_fil_post_rev_8_21_14_2_50_48_46]PIW49030.1 MAG: LPS export ABC transporter ATP-binding protein [bacterium (Candidatus Blackallbacteria) CG13_big_fil_rev_8_21_14_2_50_49_14]